MRETVVNTRSRQLKRNLILVVVVLVVASQAHEHRQLAVTERGGVLLHCVGVNEHLYALILTQVEHGILIHGLRRARSEVGDHDIESLLVVLHNLRLVRVTIAANSWRHYIVDRCLVLILLEIDGAHRHSTCRWLGVEILLIHSPLTAHKVEVSKAKHDRILEAGEEHTHEANRREVGDRTEASLCLRERDAELIPSLGLAITVAELGLDDSLVDNEVSTHLEVFRTN